MRATKPNVAALVEELPNADRPGQESKFTGPPQELARKIVTAILDGGRDSILELVDMIREADGDGEKNYKPGYALHCLVLHVGGPGMEEKRRLVVDSLLTRLGGSAPEGVKVYLVHELQVVGGPEAVAGLGKVLHDPSLCEHAAAALTAIGDGAGDALRGALPGARGKCLLAVIQALAALGDGGSVGDLRTQTRSNEEEVCLAACWGLARIADPVGVSEVLRVADKADGWMRIQATKACLLLAENLAAAGKKDAARRVCRHLIETRKDPSETYVKEAAERIQAGI